MKASSQDFDHVRVVTISGEFTADDTEAFKRTTEDRAGKVKSVILDCRELEFVDSAALESWLRLQEQLGSQGGQLRLVAPDTTVSTILELTRLNLAFESHPSIESAVRSLR
ncbi:MAG TPA: STAS domain-containing protein [Phycisphaerales bacterium]|nr:STAS domain-containing protein [Phycisphaerales bacterium]